MDLSIFFVGTGGSVPSARRGLPATLIRRGGDRLLFDCGEGTQRQLLKTVGLPDLDAIFLTHFHADHWLGLPGMLKTFDLRDRDKPLTIYGPPGVKEILGMVRPVYGRVGYPLAIQELLPGESVEFDDYRVGAFAVEHHRDRAASGYALVEDERPGRFDDARARELGVAPGPDFGRLQRGEAVNDVQPEQVVGPPRPGRRIVLSGDTAPCEATALVAAGAEVLVHEATFAEDEIDRARDTGHSTATGAAEIARRAGVKLLALTHLSTRYGGRQIRDEARAIFPATVVPRDFDTIEVPFPERGEPEVVRFDPNAQTPEPTESPVDARC